MQVVRLGAIVEGFGRNDEGMCASCDNRLNQRFAMADGRRDYAAAVLMGSATTARR